jgi:hypothetical protein
MSHFTVIVVGDEVDEQLAPYDENLAVAPYRMDIPFDYLKRMIEYYHKDKSHGNTKIAKAIREEYGTDHFPIVIDGECIASPSYPVLRELYEEWSGYELHSDEKGYYYYSTYNPNSKWDWYVIGGRWTGYFKVKAGSKVAVLGQPGVFGNKADEGTADQLLKGDIDFETMRDEAAFKAECQYATYAKLSKGLPKHIPWSEYVKRIEIEVQRREVGEITQEEFVVMRDTIRKEYFTQPVIETLQKSDEFGFMFDFDEFLVPRQTYIAQAMAGAISPYAFVKEGKWYQKGQMGWFGMSSDEMTQAEWDKIVNDMLDSLPDDTLVTLVDCHI